MKKRNFITLCLALAIVAESLPVKACLDYPNQTAIDEFVSKLRSLTPQDGWVYFHGYDWAHAEAMISLPDWEKLTSENITKIGSTHSEHGGQDCYYDYVTDHGKKKGTFTIRYSELPKNSL